MSDDININVHHVTRVEGHGNIVVQANDGQIQEIQWQVPEAPRFFEAMVRGRSWEDIQTIVARICGICSVTHSLASIKAIEAAMEIEVSEQTDILRILTHYTEQIESHILHVGYLVAPDLLGQNSVIPLVSSHPDVVMNIIKIHRLGNTWMDILGGRMTHPITLQPGRMTRIPTEAELRRYKDELEDIIPELHKLADTLLSIAGGFPDFDRDTEYIALTGPEHYTFYHGDIASTDTKERISVQNWETVTNEYVHPQSTAKWTKWHRESYAVGALARFNINGERLLPLARATAAKFGLKKGCCNPYFNNVAQLVEVVQVVEHSLQLIDKLLSRGLKAENPKVTPRAGNGAGCVEAPRGILFHRYEFDSKGICQSGDICIPTGQNHANIQKDFEVLVPRFLDQGQEKLTLLMEMLVRAYDPCISCSTHYLDVKFV